MHVYDEHNNLLRLAFSAIGEHLLMLDKEGESQDQAKYLMHRKYVNEMLRPLNFVIVCHDHFHCILPLIENEAQ
jgi:hypothetical protein